MKKSKLMLIFSSAAFTASIYMFASAVLYQPNEGMAAPAAVSSSDISSAETYSSEVFITKVIKIHDGQIAVFEQDNSEPILVMDKCIDELPDETVEQLRNGITVHTQDEYLSYLEDFS